MTRLPRSGSATIAAGAALAVMLAVAPQVDAATKPRLGVVLPDPGHVSFAVASAEIKVGKPSQLPDEVRLGFPKARRLPDSVRVVWGTRKIRERGKVTYAAAILIVNKAPAEKGQRSARSADTPARSADREPGLEELLWDMFVIDGGTCDRCDGRFHGEELITGNCPSCTKYVQDLFANLFVDQGSTKPMRNAVKDLFGGLPDNSELVFEEPRAGKKVETGDYENGRAFGWDIKSKRDERELLNEVATGIVDRDRGELVEGLEAVAKADLNGDGIVGNGAGSGTFTRAETCQFVTDPPNCSYLTAAVTFESRFQAFQIEVPGYYVAPGEDTAVYNQGGEPIGACGAFDVPSTVTHCNLDFALGQGSVVTTQVETSNDANPEGVRLPDRHGGRLFEAEPSPSKARVGGPFTITGP